MKLVSAHFVSTVPIGAGLTSAHVGPGGSNAVDVILPGRLEPDGQVAVCSVNQRADGLLIRKQVSKKGIQGEWLVSFVPWANVRSLGYG